jgi:hypothetical protein
MKSKFSIFQKFDLSDPCNAIFASFLFSIIFLLLAAQFIFNPYQSTVLGLLVFIALSLLFNRPMKSKSSIFQKFDLSDPFNATFASFLLSIISSLLAAQFKFDPYQCTVLGLLVFIALSLLQLSFTFFSFNKNSIGIITEIKKIVHLDAEFKKLNLDLVKKIVYLSGTIKEMDIRSGSLIGDLSGIGSLFDEQINNSLSACLEELSDLLDGRLIYKKNASSRMWINVMNVIHSSYLTTNILSNQSSFGQKDDSTYLEPQRKAIERGVHIERIFIYEDQRELDQYQEVIQKQKSMGVKVKVLSKEDYNLSEQEDLSRSIGCSDFAIVDGNYVYITFSDNSLTRTDYIEITKNPKRLKAAKTLFQSINPLARNI